MNLWSFLYLSIRCSHSQKLSYALKTSNGISLQPKAQYILLDFMQDWTLKWKENCMGFNINK